MATDSEQPKEKTTKRKSSQKNLAIITPSQEVVHLENTPDNLLAMAIKGGMGIDVIEKFMNLHDRWQAGIAKRAFNEAFTKFQENAPDMTKNKTASFDHKQGGGKTEYHFQELGDIAKHIRKPLAEFGLSYSFKHTENEKGEISVVCIIKHVGGHEEVGEPLKSPPDTTGNKAGLQAKASTISYLKRYTLIGALGLSSVDPDDDAQASKKVFHEKAKTGLPVPDENQFKYLMEQAKKGKLDIKDTKEKYFALTPEQESALQLCLPKPA